MLTKKKKETKDKKSQKKRTETYQLLTAKVKKKEN
jgi:hypothetical protein